MKGESYSKCCRSSLPHLGNWLRCSDIFAADHFLIPLVDRIVTEELKTRPYWDLDWMPVAGLFLDHLIHYCRRQQSLGMKCSSDACDRTNAWESWQQGFLESNLRNSSFPLLSLLSQMWAMRSIIEHSSLLGSAISFLGRPCRVDPFLKIWICAQMETYGLFLYTPSDLTRACGTITTLQSFRNAASCTC